MGKGVQFNNTQKYNFMPGNEMLDIRQNGHI